jgi:effector-binding domain-containing protein
MKFLKPFFFFLLAVLAVTAVLSLLMPTKQKIERSITINAPAAIIYQQLIKLENFNKYSVWSQRDSAVKYTLSGTDGTVGGATSWTGDPEISGDGKIEIVSLEENKMIKHKLSFSKPKKGTAESAFTLKETNGVTTVTWNFDLATPRPWNIFNLFYSLDKKMGPDFEESLATLKTIIEKINGTPVAKTYDVQLMNFPATTFAIIRQQVKWIDLLSFFEEHLPIVYQEAQNANATPGTASGLIYEWDEKNQQADIAAAVPVAAGTKIDNPIVQATNIPASKAVFVNYSGAYDKMPDAYNSIRQYLSDNKLKAKTPSIEQYFAGPSNEKDTAKWITKIVFLVE